MPSGSQRRRRARPVADAPIDHLLDRTEDLAKNWLIALVEAADLHEVSALLGVGLSAEGPALLEAVLRALADDHELHRLEPEGVQGELAARVGELCGADTPAAAVRGIEALRRTVWAALREELRRPDPDLVAELAERLALVCELLREAALDRLAGGGGQFGRVCAPGAVRAGRPPRSRRLRPLRSRLPHRRRPSRQCRLRPRRQCPCRPSRQCPPAARARSGSPRSRTRSASPTDYRCRCCWPSSRTPSESGPPRPPAGADATFDLFAQAVRGVVRGQDILVRETDTRTWIIARGTGRLGAVALGTRLADAVGEAQWRRAPLAATVGLAVLGEDGQSAVELVEAARRPGSPRRPAAPTSRVSAAPACLARRTLGLRDSPRTVGWGD